MEEFNFIFRYIRLCDLDIPKEKWLDYLQTVNSAVSHLGLHCLPVTLLGVSRLQLIKEEEELQTREVFLTKGKIKTVEHKESISDERFKKSN